ncbi:MAG: DUF302 domain-containing protein [Mycobacteriales bacterium]
MRAIETTVTGTVEEVEPAVRAALAAEGFGVLSEVDVAATLEEKLGVTRAPLKILGACNPALAHQALGLDPSVSLLLPCNVVLEADADATHVRVAAAHPADLMPDPVLADLVTEAAARLQRAMGSLSDA